MSDDQLDALLDAYRLSTQIQLRKQIESMVTCECDGCKMVPHDLKLDIIGQTLVDTIACHMHAVAGANIDSTGELVVEAFNDAKDKLQDYFLEFTPLSESGN